MERYGEKRDGELAEKQDGGLAQELLQARAHAQDAHTASGIAKKPPPTFPFSESGLCYHEAQLPSLRSLLGGLVPTYHYFHVPLHSLVRCQSEESRVDSSSSCSDGTERTRATP